MQCREYARVSGDDAKNGKRCDDECECEELDSTYARDTRKVRGRHDRMVQRPIVRNE